jgi:phosphate transport system substrate-binding protein
MAGCGFFKRYFLSGLFVSILVSFTGCGETSAPIIRVNGSTTMQPFIKKAADKYAARKGVDIQVRADGSIRGIRHLMEGRCHVAASSTPISRSQLKEVEEKGIPIKEMVLAHDLIVPIVHPSNPVSSISLDELRGIYRGHISSWGMIRGEPSKILVAERDSASGTHEVWKECVVGGKSPELDAQILSSNSAVLAFVAAHKNAIGYISRAFVNPEIKQLQLTGLNCSRYKGSQGEYPLYRELYLYVNDNNLPHEVKSFIIFLLSKEGQTMVESCGFRPLYSLSSPQE